MKIEVDAKDLIGRKAQILVGTENLGKEGIIRKIEEPYIHLEGRFYGEKRLVIYHANQLKIDFKYTYNTTKPT